VDHLEVARRRLAALREARPAPTEVTNQADSSCEISEESEQSRPAIGLGGCPPMRVPILYPMEVRWARELGWLAIRDVHTGEWHEVPARECPLSWARDANARKQSRPSGAYPLPDTSGGLRR
jgi:hypothetical protein